MPHAYVSSRSTCGAEEVARPQRVALAADAVVRRRVRGQVVARGTCRRSANACAGGRRRARSSVGAELARRSPDPATRWPKNPPSSPLVHCAHCSAQASTWRRAATRPSLARAWTRLRRYDASASGTAAMRVAIVRHASSPSVGMRSKTWRVSCSGLAITLRSPSSSPASASSRSRPSRSRIAAAQTRSLSVSIGASSRSARSLAGQRRPGLVGLRPVVGELVVVARRRRCRWRRSGAGRRRRRRTGRRAHRCGSPEDPNAARRTRNARNRSVRGRGPRAAHVAARRPERPASAPACVSPAPVVSAAATGDRRHGDRRRRRPRAGSRRRAPARSTTHRAGASRGRSAAPDRAGVGGRRTAARPRATLSVSTSVRASTGVEHRRSGSRRPADRGRRRAALAGGRPRHPVRDGRAGDGDTRGRSHSRRPRRPARIVEPVQPLGGRARPRRRSR